MFLSELIPVRDAFRILDENQRSTDTETLDLLYAHKRVLAEDLKARFDSPPFDRSAMDGYAVRAEDTFGSSPENPSRFTVIDSIGAGDVSDVDVGRGEAVKIATGAPIPSGADAVVMEEYTVSSGPEISVVRPVFPGENVAPAGEDFRAGDTVLSKGTLLRPAEIAMAASAGYSQLRVYKRPSVKVIITGNELMEPSADLEPGKIPNSNLYTLKALVESAGGEAEVIHAPDDMDIIVDEIRGAVKEHDMIITTGGTAVSRGDVVVDAVDSLGDVLFHGVAIRPGKPVAFGIVEGKPVFMLSGYPVAAMVQFDVLARYYLLRMQHLDYSHRTVKGRCLGKVASGPGRTEYVRASADNGIVKPVQSRGSGIIRSMVESNAYIVIDENLEGIAEGEECEVLLFDSMTL
ncbi:gephyrin-like molybdotransferase Glp [Methanothermobacter sp.]|uniref:molybdopterin molybdotransferase MoeA n=1 Tax=Methanothermobacter sp. TaxID=1884223 RepID=UPI0026259B11|nr:gephyrin-like molybdotransferase Glp [Methanothermobacter sp.]MDI9618661.1 molybdopterin molybdotransferase MoeA [Methanothermobacter sp.]